MHFGPVLSNAMTNGIKKQSIVNGFRVCGLFPFNVENVDFSKCVAKTTSSAPPVIHTECVNSELSSVNIPTIEETSIQSMDNSNKTIDNASFMLLSPLHVKESVLIPWTTIHEALECIGSTRILQMSSTITLNEDQQVIRTLYEKLLKPFHYQAPQVIEIENLNGDHHVEDNEVRDTEHVELYTDASPLIGNVSVDQGYSRYYTTETDPLAVRTEEIISFNSSHDSSTTFKDIGNILSRNIDISPVEQSRATYVTLGEPIDKISKTKRKRRLSSFLNCPPTPKRAKTHRNFKRQFNPVLTAGERLDELHRIECEKQNAILEKKAKAERRAKAKLEAEELKAVIKERKRQEALLRKTERENLQKDGLAKRKLMRSAK
ncbi:uncharacterized protein LOC134217257 [Armigeres subalbatus]|uniref:uncharacterized protein LOC134217257 n=1 Tax=Armigeres subalbatus TaxID=124917 RepID=UPI002ED65E57